MPRTRQWRQYRYIIQVQQLKHLWAPSGDLQKPGEGQITGLPPQLLAALVVFAEQRLLLTCARVQDAQDSKQNERKDRDQWFPVRNPSPAASPLGLDWREGAELPGPLSDSVINAKQCIKAGQGCPKQDGGIRENSLRHMSDETNKIGSTPPPP